MPELDKFFPANASPLRKSAPELIVALDVTCLDRAMNFVDQLGSLVSYYKVGPVLFSQSGPESVRALIRKNKRVFVDLKFHDIPSTVAQSCEQIARLGASLMTMHIACGEGAIREAVKALIPYPDCDLLGVGILTSLDQNDLQEIGIFAQKNLHQISNEVLLKGLQWGLSGVICSEHNLQNLMVQFSEKIMVIPGIRKSHSGEDQKRISMLKNFFPSAPQFIVVGRPIINDTDPVKAAMGFLEDLHNLS